MLKRQERQRKTKKREDLWMVQILGLSDKGFKTTMFDMMRKIEERWRISPETQNP